MDIYREQLLEHYRHPQGQGLTPGADAEAQGFNPLCGDAVHVQLDLKGDTIEAMRFAGHGCVISQATSSLLSTHVAGKSQAAVRALGRSDIEELLGLTLPPARLKCGLLCLEAVQLALTNALPAR